MAGMEQRLLTLGIKMEDLTKAVSSKIQADLKKIGTESKKTGAQGRQAGKEMAAGMTSAKAATTGILGAIQGLATGFGVLMGLRIGTKLAQDFAQFEDAMLRVASVSRATQQEYEEMTKLALKMGETTRFTAQQAADGMTFLAMAGLTVQEVIVALPSVLDAASAAQADLGETADIATNVLTGFGLSVEDLSLVMDKLIGISQTSNSTFQEMGTAFSYAGPIAKAAGQSFDDVAAILGKLHNAGIKSTRAGTILRGALTKLLKPSREANAALAQLSKTLGREIEIIDATGNLRNFLDILEDLQQAGATTSQVVKIFGQIAGTGVAALLGQGVQSIKDYSYQISFMKGRAADTAKQMESGLGGALRTLSSAFEGARLGIAKSLLPIFLVLTKTLTLLLSAFNQIPAPLKSFIILTVAATAVIVAFRIGLLATHKALVSLNIVTAEQTLLQAGLSSATVATSIAQEKLAIGTGVVRRALVGLSNILGVTTATAAGIVGVIAAMAVGFALYVHSVVTASAKAIELAHQIKGQRENLESLVEVLKKSQEGTVAYDRAVNSLLEKYPQLYKYVDLYTGKLNNAEKAIHELEVTTKKAELSAIAKALAATIKDMDRFTDGMLSLEAIWAGFKSQLKNIGDAVFDFVLYPFKVLKDFISGDFAKSYVRSFIEPLNIIYDFYNKTKSVLKSVWDENRKQSELTMSSLRKLLIIYAQAMNIGLKEALKPEYLQKFYEENKQQFADLGISYDKLLALVQQLQNETDAQTAAAIEGNKDLDKSEAELAVNRKKRQGERLAELREEQRTAKDIFSAYTKALEEAEAQGKVSKEEAALKRAQIERQYQETVVDIHKKMLVELEQNYADDEKTFKKYQKQKEKAVTELTSNMNKAWDDYIDSLKRIESLEKSNAERIKSLKEAQNDIDRKSFTDYQKWQDEKRRALQNEQKIKDLIAKGDAESLEKAAKLIDETEKLYSGLAREVKGVQDLTIITEKNATARAKEGIDNLIALEEDRAKKAIALEKVMAEKRKKHYEDLKKQIQELQDAFFQLENKQVVLDVEADTEDAIEDITDLQEQALKEITAGYNIDTDAAEEKAAEVREKLQETIVTKWVIEKEVITGHREAEPTTVAGVRGADGGEVPGSSPTPRADNIHAWLTAGEWVQPVKAVHYYGKAFMESIRLLRFPKTIASMVSGVNSLKNLRFAEGGLIPAMNGAGIGSPTISSFGEDSDTANYLGRLDLYLDGKKITVTGKKSQLEILTEEARRRARRGGNV